MTKSFLTTARTANTARCYPRILIITSCTGEKRFKPDNQLTLEDFKNSITLETRSAKLAEFACPAVQMYMGQQHLLCMEGVERLRQFFGREIVDVQILSAGYGLISENQTIVPYEVTFNTMKRYEVDEWANSLDIHQAVTKAISSYDLIFMLLGNNYLRSLRLPLETRTEQTLIFLTSKTSVSYIQGLSAKTFILSLSNKEAQHYSYGLVGLKGFLFKQFAYKVTSRPELLERVYQTPETFIQSIDCQPIQLELPGIMPAFQIKKSSVKKSKIKRIIKNELIPIPKLPQAPNYSLGMQYFIPEWDDQVDPGYNFLTDTLTPGRNPHENDWYAHQIYPSPNYYGILVSRVVVEGKKKKKAAIEQLGIKQYIRFSGPVMGDCGAFGYIQEEKPPYTTEEILDYYENAGFDYGVSIDHLIVGPFAEPGIREKRYELTLQNAEEFLQKHQSRGCKFVPVGVAQGWDNKSYADAVNELIKMGYNYIALGGLARTQTQEILEILISICPYLKADTRMHLFGVARLNAIQAFRHLGVTSFDSASSLRQAWLDSGDNYHTLPSLNSDENYQAVFGKKYAAIRVPQVDKSSVRIKRILDAGVADIETLKALEEATLKALRDYDQKKLSLEETLKKVLAYDELLELPCEGKSNSETQAKRRAKHEISYRRLLEDKPWEDCLCPICQELKIEVVIFRGNDRNRRRGFHNTYVFYKQFQELIKSSNPFSLNDGIATNTVSVKLCNR